MVKQACDRVKTDKLKTIAMSDIYFHQKVIKKYQKGGKNLFWLPLMIFCKNTGHVLSQTITMSTLLQLYLYNQKFYSLIIKGVQGMRTLISWPRIEKSIPQSMLKPLLLKNIQSVNKILQRIQQESVLKLLPPFSRTEKMTPVLNKLINQLFLKTSAAYYPQAAFNVLLLDKAANLRLLYFGNLVQILKSQWEKRPKHIDNSLKQLFKMSLRAPEGYGAISLQKRRLLHFVCDDNFLSPTRINSLLNAKSPFNMNDLYVKTSQNWTTINKRLIKRYHFELDFSNSTSQSRHLFNTNYENLYFRNQRKIEQEFEEIKKTVVEAKEAVKERLSSTNLPSFMDFKKHLDINRISDQVYQNIERRIRIERERRGL